MRARPSAEEPPPDASDLSPFDAAVAEHDRAIAATGVEIWVGAEPTFTDRFSTDPAWLVGALGADKEDRARALLAELRDGLVRASLHPRFVPVVNAVAEETPDSGCRGVLLRSVGRRYPGEKVPRWSYGLYCLRDGSPIWFGPKDPVEGGAVCEGDAGSEEEEEQEHATPTAMAIPVRTGDEVVEGTTSNAEPPAERVLRDALAAVLASSGRTVAAIDLDGKALPWRLAFRTAGEPAAGDAEEDERLARGSFHQPAPEQSAPDDSLSAEGTFLVAFGRSAASSSVRVELPALPDVSDFVALLQDLCDAARIAGVPSLVIAGHPPPVNPSAAYTTVTPDPGVVEVNMAPAPSVSTYLEWLRGIHAAAARQGLAPYRIWYNGDVADSGGGGHVTLGGPSAPESPFFLYPRLLPGLIVYLNHHPALSYLFAVDSLGSSSQSPRPDEGVREAFDELSLALALLGRLAAPSPDEIWGALAPFLADRFGNVHRAEVNVEKLWNPYLPGRGKWGVVELRALRMPPTPERGAALAALFRALAAMLALRRDVPPLVDWGPALHDRYALPFFLYADLARVLVDLTEAGLGLPAPLARELSDDDHRTIGEAVLDDVRVTVRRGIEFWPLVGDPSQQEARTARLIDSSTMRIEIVVRPLPPEEPETDETRPDALPPSSGVARLAAWRLAVSGVVAPMPVEEDASGPALVLGVRLRAFVPTPGLHPSLGKQLPVELLFHRPGADDGWSITLHDWDPDGGGYDGIPEDLGEARRRRAARFVVARVPLTDRTLVPAPPEALSAHALDLRRARPA